MSVKSKLDIYALENYTQTSIDAANAVSTAASPEMSLGGGVGSSSVRPKTMLEKLTTLKKRCDEEQCVRSVEGVLLVHLHRHPHVVLLKQSLQKNRDANGPRVVPPLHTNVDVVYRLPGGRCRRGESEELALLRKLGRHLLSEPRISPSSPAAMTSATGETVVDVGVSHGTSKAGSHFRVGELLSMWYRPHFTPLMYPYVPAHVAVSSLKEIRSVFLVHMEPSVYFTLVQQGVELIAAPLFDLYDNSGKYGPIIASLPAALSRVLINYCSTDY